MGCLNKGEKFLKENIEEIIEQIESLIKVKVENKENKQIQDEIEYIIKFKFKSKEFNNLFFKTLISNECKVKFTFKKEYLEIIGIDNLPHCLFYINIPKYYFEIYDIKQEKSFYIDFDNSFELDEIDNIEIFFSGPMHFLANKKDNKLILRREIYKEDFTFKELDESKRETINAYFKRYNNLNNLNIYDCYFSIKRKYIIPILNTFNSHNYEYIKIFINKNNIHFNYKDIISNDINRFHLDFKIDKSYLYDILVKKTSKIAIKNYIIQEILKFVKIENYKSIEFEIISLFVLKMKIKTENELKCIFYLAPYTYDFESKQYDKIKLKMKKISKQKQIY